VNTKQRMILGTLIEGNFVPAIPELNMCRQVILASIANVFEYEKAGFE
jgi:hypothetical protein